MGKRKRKGKGKGKRRYKKEKGKTKVRKRRSELVPDRGRWTRPVLRPCPGPLPSKARLLLPQRGSTLSGSEAPSLLPSPPSSRCGSPSRNMMSAAHPLSTASASKFLSYTQSLLKKQIQSKNNIVSLIVLFGCPKRRGCLEFILSISQL